MSFVCYFSKVVFDHEILYVKATCIVVRPSIFLHNLLELCIFKLRPGEHHNPLFFKDSAQKSASSATNSTFLNFFNKLQCVSIIFVEAAVKTHGLSCADPEFNHPGTHECSSYIEFFYAVVNLIRIIHSFESNGSD